MAIYRGPGGSGDAVNDSSSETRLAVEARDAALVAQAAAEAAQAAAETAETNAQTAETNAETAETNAETAATNAASSASSASSSASAASTSATNAASSASSASTSATNAASSASSASTSASNASTSATNAASSATTASTAATNASNSATSAASSASTATTKASEASTSATNAASSASSASSSASTATTQAGIATTKASEASTSATNAANSASAAATSETNAASSASSASTSATNAASSATAASSAQSAAEAARDAALSAYDNFDDRYLGPKASDPTLDNDGNALVAGALYFNTSSNVMNVYTGSSWVAAYVSAAGVLLQANNLSDLANASTARTNLGLGTAATTASTDYATAAQGAKADTALQSADIGVSIQAYDADLTSWAAITPSTKQDTLVSGTNIKTVNGTSLLGAGNLAVGTVTSVGVTVPTGLSISGSPITGSGTLAVTYTAGYSIPTTASQTNWDSAYTQRLQWDGGSTNLVASTGRTSLGGTTVGQNFFTLTNPTAVTFPRINADNTVSALARQDAMDALAGSTTSGQYLRGNGTDVVMSAIQAADVPTLNQNTTGSAATLTTGRTIAITGDLTWTSPSFNGSTNVTAVGTLATVNTNVGSFGSSTAIPIITVNGKGLVTAVSTATVAGGQYFGTAATKAIAYNSNTISENITVTAGNNGLSAGPVTVSTGYTVTVETGANWVIV